jgi:hypothetical protein
MLNRTNMTDVPPNVMNHTHESILHLIYPYILQTGTPADIARFSMVDKQAYTFFTQTNVNNELCKPLCKASSYHFTQTLLQASKLNHCMNIVDIIYTLSNQHIPLHTCACNITLRASCGTTIYMVFGRHLIINNIIYTFSPSDAMYDIQCGRMKYVHSYKRNYTILHIDTCMTRLRHKMNSIISHIYHDVHVSVIGKNSGTCCGTCKDVCDAVHRYVISCITSYSMRQE